MRHLTHPARERNDSNNHDGNIAITVTYPLQARIPKKRSSSSVADRLVRLLLFVARRRRLARHLLLPLRICTIVQPSIPLPAVSRAVPVDYRRRK